MKYSANWRLCFVVSLIVHFILWSVLTFVVPLLDFSSAKVSDDAIMLEDLPTGYEGPGWGNGEGEGTGFGDGTGVGAPQNEDDKAINKEIGESTTSEDNEGDAMNYDESDEEVLDSSEENAEDTETSPIIADNEADAIAQLEEQVKQAKKDSTKKVSSVIIIGKGTEGGGSGGNGRGGGKPQIGTPPKLIEDFYPPNNLVPFKGRIRVFATIGKDGLIHKTSIAVTSGKRSYDEIAMSAARKWRFKPALDENGEPMEVTRVISISFNRPNIARQINERKYSD